MARIGVLIQPMVPWMARHGYRNDATTSSAITRRLHRKRSSPAGLPAPGWESAPAQTCQLQADIMCIIG